MGETKTSDATRHPLGFETVSGLSAAKGLTKPAGATAAWIQAETQDVRWRDDGTDPDASTGILLAAGESIYYVADLSAIKFFETAASATLNVSYYK